MKKALVLLIGLLFALNAWADVTENAQTTVIDGDAYYLLNFVVSDSECTTTADTSRLVYMLPWGEDKGYPDAVTIYSKFTEFSENGSTTGDTCVFHIDVCFARDSTSLRKGSDSWARISGTSGSATYASRTGKTDTLTAAWGLIEDGSGAVSYAFTATQLAVAAPYIRIRWDFLETVVAADSFRVNMWIAMSRNLDK